MDERAANAARFRIIGNENLRIVRGSMRGFADEHNEIKGENCVARRSLFLAPLVQRGDKGEIVKIRASF